MQTLSIKLTLPIMVVFVIVGLAVYISINNLVRSSLYQDILNRHRVSVQKIPRPDIEKVFMDPLSEQSQTDFERFYMIIRDPTVGRFTIWDLQGNIVFSDYRALIGQSDPNYEEINNVKTTKAPEFSLKHEDTGNIIQTNFGEFLDMFIPLEDTRGNVAGILELHGSLRAVLSPLQSALRTIYFVLGVSLAVLFVVIALAVRHLIMRPLNMLGNTAQNIASGTYTREKRSWPDDEVGRAGKAFDLMLLALEERRQKLEQANDSLKNSAEALNKKNDELEEMNKFMMGRELKMAELKKEIESLKRGKAGDIGT